MGLILFVFCLIIQQPFSSALKMADVEGFDLITQESDVHVRVKISTYLNIGPTTLDTRKHTNIRPMKESITSNSIHKVLTNSSDKQ